MAMKAVEEQPPALDSIRAIVFREGNWYVAQCLEVDIATQAKSLGALREELERMLKGYGEVAREEQAQPFAGLPEAPKKFHDMWEHAWQYDTPAFTIQVTPPISLRAAFA